MKRRHIPILAIMPHGRLTTERDVRVVDLTTGADISNRVPTSYIEDFRAATVGSRLKVSLYLKPLRLAPRRWWQWRDRVATEPVVLDVQAVSTQKADLG